MAGTPASAPVQAQPVTAQPIAYVMEMPAPGAAKHAGSRRTHFTLEARNLCFDRRNAEFGSEDRVYERAHCRGAQPNR